MSRAHMSPVEPQMDRTKFVKCCGEVAMAIIEIKTPRRRTGAMGLALVVRHCFCRLFEIPTYLGVCVKGFFCFAVAQPG